MAGTTYPGAIDTGIQSNKQDDFDSTSGADTSGATAVGDHAQHHNDLALAVLALENELGVNPRGTSATVRERIEAQTFKALSCKAASTASLALTYGNGAAGVGASVTAQSNGVLPAIDGVSLSVGDRFLLKNQGGAAAVQNGIYTVTSVGSAGGAYQFTRATDADTSAKAADIKVIVDQGTANGDTEWFQSATAPVMGTTSLYFRRTLPIYGTGAPRSPWVPGGSITAAPVSIETVPRNMATGVYTHPVTAQLQTLVGGITLPAGRPVNNVNVFVYAAGAAPTVSYWLLVRQSDRVVLAVTTNSTAAPTSANAVHTRALSSAFTPVEDTPVWVVFGIVNATTAMTLAGGAIPATAATVAAFMLAAPASFATNGVTPTTTVPAAASVLTAATVGSQLALPYIWLS